MVLYGWDYRFSIFGGERRFKRSLMGMVPPVVQLSAYTNGKNIENTNHINNYIRKNDALEAVDFVPPTH